ncbi:ribulose-phosphate 3-epimerase [Murdochiella massiliensis]|uniref:ribulose-phosphate 3-epimerase n=1 Tax=Murdochiella massiliensis TaxID=1673723 RepID=UPI00082974C4|nr:ribulose-phosphate 3-epimerase [Murdochiella massiliensis]
MDRQLAPSLLSADFFNLEKEITALEKAGVTHLHLDVMDGQYVQNITFGPNVIARLRKHTSLFFDTHLMVKEPSCLFPAFQKAGCELLTIHTEGVTHSYRALQEIHDLGMKAGVAINPGTPVCAVEELLPEADLLLIMSVNPGFGGQYFIPSMLDKIRKAKRMIEASGREIILEVDGGIRLDNVDEVLEAGCDWVVAGSAVFGSDTYGSAKAFMEHMKK